MLSTIRALTTAHCAAILFQAVLAGNYLSGGFDAISIHRANAALVILLGLMQALAAGLLWRSRRGPTWPLIASVLICAAELMQIGAGRARELGLHVPLGVSLFAATALCWAWAWTLREQRV